MTEDYVDTAVADNAAPAGGTTSGGPIYYTNII